MLDPGRTAYPVGVDHLVVTQVDRHVRDDALGGVEDEVPTLPLAQRHVHETRVVVELFDVYRLCDEEEMYELGYEEYFFGDGVCVVEWADTIEELIPEDAVWINIKYGSGPEERIYECTF